MTEEEFGKLKPSELILVALADLEKVEKDSRYVVNMGVWHQPMYGVCHVCLAGACIAMQGFREPGMFASSLNHKDADKRIDALNDFRSGDVWQALSAMEIALPQQLEEYRQMTPYSVDPDQFKADMRTLAADLAAANL